MASTDKTVYRSNEFSISCGTVCVDIERSKVLLIRCQKTGDIMLPKGRKDIGEALEKTAIRETFEETGMKAGLLPVSIPTLATTPSSAKKAPDSVTEPIATTLRKAGGILKIIFWFAATADSTSTPEQGTQQEDEQFDTIWTDFNNVGSTLSFGDDKGVVQEAIAAVSKRLIAVS